MRYAIIVEQSEHNFGAYVPDLPGCVAAARTKNEVVTLIREAIVLHIQALRADGQPVPMPTTAAEYVEL